jgi:hypothetical protein
MQIVDLVHDVCLVVCGGLLGRGFSGMNCELRQSWEMFVRDGQVMVVKVSHRLPTHFTQQSSTPTSTCST